MCIIMAMNSNSSVTRPSGMPVMTYCSRCTYPIVAVNLAIGKGGMCSGCIVHDEKEALDWSVRCERVKSMIYSSRNKDDKSKD